MIKLGSLADRAPVKIVGDLRIRAFRVAWVCEELGLPYELEQTWPWTEKIYELNPLGKVPVLIDGDFVLYESAAILNYLAEKYQEKAGIKLIPPPGTQERARFDQFLMIIFTDLESFGLYTHRKFIDLAQHASNLDRMKQLGFIHIPETAAPAKAAFDRALKVLVIELKQGHTYLLGEDFQLLDIHLLRDLEWAEALGWLTGNPDEALIREYYERVRMRTAYKTCWKMRAPLDVSNPALSSFTPKDQLAPREA